VLVASNIKKRRIQIGHSSRANLEVSNPPAYGKQGHAAMANKKPKKNLPNTLAIKHSMQRETLLQLPNKYSTE
jgi:hypothetical protein